MLPNPQFHSVMVIAFACDVKSFAIAFLVFFLLLLVSVFKWTSKIFLRMFQRLLPRMHVTKIALIAFACKTKGFAIVFLFLLLLISVFEWSGKCFLLFHILLPWMRMTSTGLVSLDTLENDCVKNVLLIWNFLCVSKLEKIVMAEPSR